LTAAADVAAAGAAAVAALLLLLSVAMRLLLPAAMWLLLLAALLPATVVVLTVLATAAGTGAVASVAVAALRLWLSAATAAPQVAAAPGAVAVADVRLRLMLLLLTISLTSLSARRSNDAHPAPLRNFSLRLALAPPYLPLHSGQNSAILACWQVCPPVFSATGMPWLLLVPCASNGHLTSLRNPLGFAHPPRVGSNPASASVCQNDAELSIGVPANVSLSAMSLMLPADVASPVELASLAAVDAHLRRLCTEHEVGPTAVAGLPRSPFAVPSSDDLPVAPFKTLGILAPTSGIAADICGGLLSCSSRVLSEAS
jgi:hypothetical protein